MSIIVLNATTKSIEALLSGAVATNQPEFSAHYADVTATAFTESENDGVLNNTTAVSLVAAPAASTRRIVKEITIYNADTAAVTVTIRINNNGSYRRIQKVTLAAGATWKLSDGGVSTSSGSGDVVGPAIATDGHLVVFDGVTGKLVKDGGAVPTGGGGGQPFGGFLINGKIAVTVTSNNINVAIKTLANADPSAGDKVQVLINGVIRDIISALSVTKNAATSWCNAGSAELATKEIDWFTYLIWNTNLGTPAVDLLFSRIPDANLYSDFSATTTNEKHACINSTAPAATDVCVNIGRFAATLSAGAGYTWSVPTFTALNLIQRPIYETRELDYVAVFSGITVSSKTVVGKYRLINKEISCYVKLTMGATPSALSTLTCTIPFTGLYSSLGFFYIEDYATAGYTGTYSLGTTQLVFRVAKTDSIYFSYADFSLSVPFTWTTNDFIELTTKYFVSP